MIDNAYDTYIQATLAHFDDFVMKAIGRRPVEAGTLSKVDFAKARYEILILLDRNISARDAVVGSAGTQAQSDSGKASSEQYLPVTPAPWP